MMVMSICMALEESLFPASTDTIGLPGFPDYHMPRQGRK